MDTSSDTTYVDYSIVRELPPAPAAADPPAVPPEYWSSITTDEAEEVSPSQEAPPPPPATPPVAPPLELHNQFFANFANEFADMAQADGLPQEQAETDHEGGHAVAGPITGGSSEANSGGSGSPVGSVGSVGSGGQAQEASGSTTAQTESSSHSQQMVFMTQSAQAGQAQAAVAPAAGSAVAVATSFDATPSLSAAPQSTTEVAGKAPSPGPGTQDSATIAPDESAVMQAFLSQGLRFEQNVGQFGAGFDFVARAGGYSVATNSTEALVSLNPTNGNPDPTLIGMDIVGGNARAQAVGQGILPGLTNYLSGDSSQTYTGIRSYAQVTYQDVYAGIDLSYHTSASDKQALEYDFTVAPGANVSQIALGFSGVQGMSLDARGDLVLHTSAGDLLQQGPVAYQDIGGIRHDVSSSFTLSADGQLHFALGRYNPNYSVVIDPVYNYSSYAGGTQGSDARAIAVSKLGDGTERVFLVGSTTSTTFRPSDNGRNPITPTVLPGGGNLANGAAFVLCVNPANNDPVYLTYLTGNAASIATGVVADQQITYITGNTSATANFPITVGAWQANYGGGSTDTFVASPNATGQAATFCTYLGGLGDDAATSIGWDGNSTLYVAGHTTSWNFNGHNADARFGPTQGQDGFVARLTTQGQLNSLVWIGGSDQDTINGLAVGQGGNVYVTGETYSTDLLVGTNPTNAPFQNALLGGRDALVARLTYGAGAVPTLVYDTYFGGTSMDTGYGIAVDGAGNAYVVGDTQSDPNLGWGVRGNIASPVVLGSSGNIDAWVAKFDPTGNPNAASYFVYLAGLQNDTAQSVVAFSSGGTTNLYVAGTTYSNDSPTGDKFPTSGNTKLQNFNQNGLGSGTFSDAFLARLNPSALTGLASRIFLSYIGGTNSEWGKGVALDALDQNSAWVGGNTASTDFRPAMNPPPGMQTAAGLPAGQFEGFFVSVNSNPA